MSDFSLIIPHVIVNARNTRRGTSLLFGHTARNRAFVRTSPIDQRLLHITLFRITSLAITIYYIITVD